MTASDKQCRYTAPGPFPTDLVLNWLLFKYPEDPRYFRPCIHGVGITLVAGITLPEGTTHVIALLYLPGLSLGLTRSTVKTHTAFQRNQIRGIVVRLIPNNQAKIYW